MKKLNYLLTAVLLITVVTAFSQNRKDLSQSSFTETKTLKKEIVSTTEKSPLTSNGTHHVQSNSRAIWDVEFNFNASAAGNPGIETDGVNFYTVTWDAGDFTRYDMDGSNPVTFQVAGATNIRDMAYDGTYFYGSDASMNLYQLDLANETLVSTISATCTGVTGIRHIAYDPTLDSGNGGFWIGNWEELGAIDMNGTELVASTVTLESCYGSAYDAWTDPSNPCLWLFQQPTGAEAVFYQFDINTYSMTGITHDCADAPGYDSANDASSGGACTMELNGKAILVGNIQQDPNLVVAYELAILADPSAPAAVTELSATPDATGALTAEINWTNPALDFSGNTLSELTIIELFIDESDVADYTNNSPVIGGAETHTSTVTTAGMHTFTIIGTNTSGEGIANSISIWVGEDVPSAPTNIVLASSEMDATVTWEAPTTGLHSGYFSGTGLTYDVIRHPGAVLVADDQTELTFSETLTTAGNYSYEIIASNAIGIGGSDISNTVLFGSFLLYEDFESGATTWTQEGTGEWTFQAGGADGNPATAHEGENNAFHGHSTNGNSTKLISPEALISSNGYYELKFWMAQVNWAGDQDQLKVYFKSGASGDWVELATYDNEVATWTEETIVFYSSEAPYIAFEGIDGYGYGNCVDFVTMVETSPTCLAPSSLAATPAQTTAQLSWVDEIGDTWNIEWGETGFTQGEGTMINGNTDNPYSLTDLTAGTIYNFYMQTDCGSGVTSDWTGPFTFTTLCNDITTFPYSEDFENGLNCWTTMKNTAADGGLDGTNLIATDTWFQITPESFSGNGANYIYEGNASAGIGYEAPDFNWLISNDIILDDAEKELRFYLWYKSDAAESWITKFHVMVFDGTNWVNELSYGEETPNNEFAEQVIINLADYANSTIKVAFVYEYNDGFELAIDNVEIDNPVGIIDDANESISIYPNPANDVVVIENAENANISIYNMVGQVVASEVANSNKTSVNIAELAEGTYVIRIEKGNEVSTKKLNVIR